jgi:hypothetical protein
VQENLAESPRKCWQSNSKNNRPAVLDNPMVPMAIEALEDPSLWRTMTLQQQQELWSSWKVAVEPAVEPVAAPVALPVVVECLQQLNLRQQVALSSKGRSY